MNRWSPKMELVFITAGLLFLPISAPSKEKEVSSTCQDNPDSSKVYSTSLPSYMTSSSSEILDIFSLNKKITMMGVDTLFEFNRKHPKRIEKGKMLDSTSLLDDYK